MNVPYMQLFLRRCHLGRIQVRTYAEDVKSVFGIPQNINHCSGLPPQNSYVTESRTLLIQKSLENLKSQKIKINNPGVKIKINDRFQCKGTDGASLFLYEKVPVLKYHNPDVSINCTRDATLPWDVSVSVDDGDWVSVQVDGRTSDEIFQDIAILLDAEIEGETSIENVMFQASESA